MSSWLPSSRILSTYSCVALERLQRRADDERDVVAREVVLVEQVADLDLDELQELVVVDHVGLVEEHDDVRHAHLTGEQDVLARLRHRAVGRRDHEDRAVHLGGTRDHVLHVIGVTRAVDVGVVTRLGLVLDVRRGDGDAAGLLLRSVVDLLEGPGLPAVLLGQDLGDGRRQGRLAMVDVTDGADVDVRLVPRELLLRHFLFAPILKSVLRRTRADYRVYAGTGTPVRPSTTFSAMLGGTSSYLSNCMVYVARPWDIVRTSVA